MNKKYNYFTLRLKFKNPPHQTLDFALMLHSARLELKWVIFSTTFYVRCEQGRYLIVFQMEWLIDQN